MHYEYNPVNADSSKPRTLASSTNAPDARVMVRHVAANTVHTFNARWTSGGWSFDSSHAPSWVNTCEVHWALEGLEDVPQGQSSAHTHENVHYEAVDIVTTTFH